MEEIKTSGEYSLFVSDSIEEKRQLLLEIAKKQIAKYSPFDILCPKYLDCNGRLFYAGGGFTLHDHVPYPDAQGEDDINQYPKIREVEFSPLWAFLISKKAKKRLGPIPDFGTNIYAHARFIIKARKMGFKIKVSPDFKVNYRRAYFMVRKRKMWIALFTRLHKDFKKKHAKFLDKPYRLPVVLHTHTGYPGGYCMHARQFISALLRKKIKIYYKFIGGCNDDEPESDIFPLDDLRVDMGSMKLPQIVLSTGLNCFSNSGAYKIGFTTTEVDGIPKGWVKVLNEMNEVWTTSEFAKEAIKSSGCLRPIYNIPEGVDPNYFHPGIKPFDKMVKQKFLFVSNFAWGRRKGVDVLFEAFSKEFSDDEDVALALKVLPSYHGEDIKKEITKLYHRPHSAPITVWDTVIPSYLLGGLYTACQAFVLPTRGEGFGIPPAEALASGLPVITSDYSAQKEFLIKNGKPLPGVELIKGHKAKFDGSDSAYYTGFNWFQPSMSHLRYLMRKVYTNYKEYRKGALESSKYIRREWSWGRGADLAIKRLEEISKNKLK